MDKLKSAIADKILDLSNSGGDEIRIKLEKINRFRDFTEACRSLIQKYPTIESELMRMVENNDFDTKIASSRVDTIIRLSENNSPSNPIHHNIEKDIHELEDIKEQLPTPPLSETPTQIEEKEQLIKEIVSSIETEKSTSPKYLPEDIDYEEIISIPTIEKEYADFEEVTPDNDSPMDPLNRESSIKEIETRDSKENIKKGLLVCSIIAVIIALIFIVKFVINNWETILWIIGGLIVIGIAGIIIKRNIK